MDQKANRRRNALVLFAAFVAACSIDTRMIGDAMIDAGTLLHDATRSDAAAQEMPCTQWEVAVWRARDECGSNVFVRDGDSCMVPPGWEPVQFDYADVSGNAVLRRCTAR
ncbi:MAG: hypothetical protein J0L92_24295 [Deltaproteobacteria bacterium]|nr:hypothetical protein [Deltaproteobacteria bacterium]